MAAAASDRKQARVWAEDALLAIIRDYYDLWRSSAVQRSEPCLTAASLFDELAQRNQPDAYQFLSKKHQRLIVFSALESLRKKGRLGSSTGEGGSGREARCYEPAPPPRSSDAPSRTSR
jgi:hypothetical protein